MSSAIKCDRCGYSSVKMSEFRQIRTHMMNEPLTLRNTIDYFEICEKCYDEIFDFRNSNERE